MMAPTTCNREKETSSEMNPFLTLPSYLSSVVSWGAAFCFRLTVTEIFYGAFESCCLNISCKSAGYLMSSDYTLIITFTVLSDL